MKRKLIIMLLGLFLITGCNDKETVNEVKGVENPIVVDKATKVVTKEIEKEDSVVKSFYLEYIFEDNFCTKAIYHTKYNIKANTEYNLETIIDDPEYEDAYIDDDGYLVYTFKGDGLLGKSVRNILIYLQYDKLMEVEVYND